MDDIASHLEARYEIAVATATEIEPGGAVYRVDRADDGPAWIARVFASDRTRAAVASDAAILSWVAAHGFPAERLAHEQPLSTFGDRHVLVTDLVEGVNGRPDRSVAMFEALGDLLGRLHTMPIPDGARPAGGWHHLSRNGGTRMADVEVLLGRLTDDRLREELSSLADDAHLPQVLLHPDLSSPNVMTPPGGDPVVIDWTGAGRGARVAGVGVGVFGAGDAHLIDALIAAYRRHVQLEPEELAELANAVWSFPLVLDAWLAMTYPAMTPGVINGLTAKRKNAEAMAAHAVAAFRS